MTTTRTQTAQPIDILLVEDNPGDVRLTEEAFKEGRIENNIHVARDGVEALAFLRKEGTFDDAPRPDLVLLDLNLPRMNGDEVLATLKADDELKSIPVVVLTSSKAEEDIVTSYKHHANAYLTKPIDPAAFIETVRSFEEFWFSVVRLPPVEDGR
ncbi:response regulator [Natronobiforma cellulositropha]|uniref:response regulator n=1 Tax=Natronobiforma cellulositropha TaxID=1679076 RepID=UPI0021D5BEA4|nr:response regulator [Natronobiforma cellulositropha]